jgi:2-polyprenyl-3-methyl-5-hydroxy-6-metoxy-1,4-benzoquinol methylase
MYSNALLSRLMIDFISPVTKEKLSQQNGHLISAAGESFPVIKGIPRFVPLDNYASAFGLQWNTFSKTQLDSHSQIGITLERLERCLGYPVAQLNGKTVLEVGCGAGRFTELRLFIQ